MSQESLFTNSMDGSGASPAPPPPDQWDRAATKGMLDELFFLTDRYRKSGEYRDLLRFVARFHYYSPFNAMLVHTQMPGARFVASPTRWWKRFRRRVRTGGRPLVILRPGGPVMFVFDVADTEPEQDAPSLPRGVVNPFEARAGKIGKQLTRTIENARRDGVLIEEVQAGSQHAGSIRRATSGRRIDFPSGPPFTTEPARVPLRYTLLIAGTLSPEGKYATLVHELAHLYCGHLGTPDTRWWPDRRGLDHATQEFEAESVTWLVCERLGIENPSAEYLAGYVTNNSEVPSVSLDCVMKAGGMIEKMGRERMKRRKERG